MKYQKEKLIKALKNNIECAEYISSAGLLYLNVRGISLSIYSPKTSKDKTRPNIGGYIRYESEEHPLSEKEFDDVLSLFLEVQKNKNLEILNELCGEEQYGWRPTPKNKTTIENAIQMAKSAGVVPIDAEKQNEPKITLLFNINMLPKEYDTETGIEDYEKDFNVKLIPYDDSKERMRERGGISDIGIQKI